MSEYHCTTKPNDPVYPEGTVSGLTIREYFAVLAMQGMGHCMRSDSNYSKLDREALYPEKDAMWLSNAAVRYADALIEALNREAKTNG